MSNRQASEQRERHREALRRLLTPLTDAEFEALGGGVTRAELDAAIERAAPRALHRRIAQWRL